MSRRRSCVLSEARGVWQATSGPCYQGPEFTLLFVVMHEPDKHQPYCMNLTNVNLTGIQGQGWLEMCGVSSRLQPSSV